MAIEYCYDVPDLWTRQTAVGRSMEIQGGDLLRHKSLVVFLRTLTAVLPRPEFNMPISTDSPSSDLVSSFPQYIFQGESLIGKEAQVITNDMAIRAARTVYQHGSAVIAKFGYSMGRALAAWLTGERELVRRLLFRNVGLILGRCCRW